MKRKAICDRAGCGRAVWAFFMARTWPYRIGSQVGPKQGLRGSKMSGESQGHGHQDTSKRKVWGGVACEVC